MLLPVTRSLLLSRGCCRSGVDEATKLLNRTITDVTLVTYRELLDAGVPTAHVLEAMFVADAPARRRARLWIIDVYEARAALIRLLLPLYEAVRPGDIHAVELRDKLVPAYKVIREVMESGSSLDLCIDRLLTSQSYTHGVWASQEAGKASSDTHLPVLEAIEDASPEEVLRAAFECDHVTFAGMAAGALFISSITSQLICDDQDEVSSAVTEIASDFERMCRGWLRSHVIDEVSSHITDTEAYAALREKVRRAVYAKLAAR